MASKASKEAAPEPSGSSAAQLKAGCRQAKKAPVAFFFCAAGEDGEPVLLIGKRIQAQVKAVRKAAKERKFVRGKLSVENKKLTFHADKPGDTRFARALRETFGKEFPPLKGAVIVPLTEADTQESLKDELKAEVARREARREAREAQDSGDSERIWRTRYRELKTDLNPKLEVVANAEQAIALRLESGSTEKVRERLVKNRERLVRLIALARKKLSEVRS